MLIAVIVFSDGDCHDPRLSCQPLACACLRPLPATLAVVSAAFAYIVAAHHEFASSALWLPVVVPLAVQAPLAGIAGLGLHYFTGKREREEIKRAFGHFLPKAVVDQLARNMGQLSRRHEFQADAFAVSQTGREDLRTALLKLYEDNASTLTPDPLFVKFYYSHPPASERLARMATAGGAA